MRRASDSVKRQRARPRGERVERVHGRRGRRPGVVAAGSRRDAEENAREASERAARWREMRFEEVWREHLPLDYEPQSVAERGAFVARMEATVAFAKPSGAADGAAERVHLEAALAAEGEAMREVIDCAGSEVLATELDDVHRRRQAQRERLRQLLPRPSAPMRAPPRGTARRRRRVAIGSRVGAELASSSSPTGCATASRRARRAGAARRAARRAAATDRGAPKGEGGRAGDARRRVRSEAVSTGVHTYVKF